MFNFMISLFKPCLVLINNSEWNSIWIFEFLNNLVNWLVHIFYLKNSLLIMNAICSESNCANVFTIKSLIKKELSFNVFTIKLFAISICTYHLQHDPLSIMNYFFSTNCWVFLKPTHCTSHGQVPIFKLHIF
jgi:hypothetical protein